MGLNVSLPCLVFTAILVFYFTLSLSIKSQESSFLKEVGFLEKEEEEEEEEIANQSWKGVQVEHFLKPLRWSTELYFLYIDPSNAEVSPPALAILTDHTIDQQIVSRISVLLLCTQLLSLHHFISILMIIRWFQKA